MIIPTAKKSLIYTLERMYTPGSVTHSLRAKRANKIKRRDGSRSGTVLGQMVERRKGLHTRHRNTHGRLYLLVEIQRHVQQNGRT
jgi:hypothetical protein